MPDTSRVESRARGAGDPLQQWLERETRIAAATRPIRRALDQHERYTDRRGTRHPLAGMSSEEAALTLAFLDRHARLLHRGELGKYLLRPYPQRRAQHALDEQHRRLAATSAADWLRRTRLYRALTERAGQ